MFTMKNPLHYPWVIYTAITFARGAGVECGAWDRMLVTALTDVKYIDFTY
jgi:hypothetical protein